MTNKKEFIENALVIEFTEWLQEKLPNLKVKLRILPSRFVQSGLKTDIVGVEAALENYQWHSQWTNSIGTPQISHSWPDTRDSLHALGNWLRDSIKEKDEIATLKACMEILKWGGVYKQGSINFLNGLYQNNQLVTYLVDVQNAMSLNSSPNNINELDPIIKLFNSGLTKIHALSSIDGLPIYDSRVGATISALSTLYEEETKNHCQHLIFPTASAVGNQLRNPGDFPGFKKSPQFYTKKVTHAQWAKAQVKLGWIFENILQNTDLFAIEDSLVLRMHALEASFFMIGYDLRALPDINNEANHLLKKLPKKKAPKTIQPTNSGLQLFSQQLDGGYVPTVHNFQNVILWYLQFRQENNNNQELSYFAQWLIDQPDINVNTIKTANACCYPLKPDQFDIALFTDEQVAEIAVKPDGQFTWNFLTKYQGLPLEEIPRCLIDIFIIGTLAIKGYNGSEITNHIVKMGLAGNTNAARNIKSVGKPLGVHFNLLTNETGHHPPQPTEQFFQLFSHE